MSPPYGYDAAHRLVALGYPGGREVEFTYDADGRLTHRIQYRPC
jgi:YD repeat-containing protein